MLDVQDIEAQDIVVALGRWYLSLHQDGIAQEERERVKRTLDYVEEKLRRHRHRQARSASSRKPSQSVPDQAGVHL